MKFLPITFLALMLSVCSFAQINFTSSNLPIIKINTGGLEVPNDVKLTATIQIISNSQGNLNTINSFANQYNGKMGIEKRGSTSLFLSEKAPYSIELRNAAGEDSTVSLFGWPPEADYVLLAPYSDKTFIREVLTYEWGLNMMSWAPRTQLVEITLNNEYQGVYVLAENIKRDPGRVDIARMKETDNAGDSLTGGYIFKLDKCSGESGCSYLFSQFPSPNSNISIAYQPHYPNSEDITQPQADYLQQVINNFESSIASSNFNDPTTGYAATIDVQSFVNFLLINEITRNVDGYRLSSFLHKDKDSDGGKVVAGPIWDFNIALGNADYCDGQLIEGWAYNFNYVCGGDGFQIPFYWERLLQDDNFKSLVRYTWEQQRAHQWHLDSLDARIDDLSDQLAPASLRNFLKWPILGQYVWPNSYIGSTYYEEIYHLKDWLTDRIIWMDGQFANYPVGNQNIKPSIESLTVFPNPVSPNGLLQWQTQQAGTATLYDMIGQKVQTEQFLSPGNLQIKMPSTKGVYRLVFQTINGQISAASVLVQ